MTLPRFSRHIPMKKMNQENNKDRQSAMIKQSIQLQ